jgi:hypothetical protein
LNSTVSLRTYDNMVQWYSLLAGCAVLVTILAAPIAFPIGNIGQSLSISEDGQTISIEGRTLYFRHEAGNAQSCSTGRGGKHGLGTGMKGVGNGTATMAKAIYFITNDAQNSIVALKVAGDGTLSDGSVTSTGGAGMTGVDANGSPAVPDGLFSQGAVKVAGKVRNENVPNKGVDANFCSILSPSTLDQTPSPCLPLTPRTQPS